MTQSVLDARTAALDGLLDDRGLRAAAAPGAAEALERHRALRAGPAAWLVGRLLVPAAALSELLLAAGAGRVADPDAEAADDARADDAPADDAPRIDVLLPRAAAGEAGRALARDLAPLLSLLAEGSAPVTVRGVHVAPAGRQPASEIAAAVEALRAADLPADVELAVEVPVGQRPPGEVVRLLEAVAAAGAGAGRQVVASLALGAGQGGGADDGDVAGALLACARTGVPARAAARGVPAVRAADGGGAGPGVLNLLAAAAIAARGGRLDAVRAALEAVGDAVRLGSGALIAGDAVVESDALAATRAGGLLGVACDDVAALVADLAGRGAVGEAGAAP
jgi:hypothetical protein